LEQKKRIQDITRRINKHVKKIGDKFGIPNIIASSIGSFIHYYSLVEDAKMFPILEKYGLQPMKH